MLGNVPRGSSPAADYQAMLAHQNMLAAASSNASMSDVLQRGMMLVGSSAQPPPVNPPPNPMTTPQQSVFGWPYDQHAGAPTPTPPMHGIGFHRSPSVVSFPTATPSPAVAQVVADLRTRLAQEQQRNAMAAQALIAKDSEVRALRNALHAKTISAEDIFQTLVQRQAEVQGGTNGTSQPLALAPPSALVPPALPDPATLPPAPSMPKSPVSPGPPKSPPAPVLGELHAATPRQGKRLLKELKSAVADRAERMEEDAARAAKEAEEAAIRARLEDEVRAKLAEEAKVEAAAKAAEADAKASRAAGDGLGASGWRAVADEHGRVYYANDETGESSWSIPDGVTLDADGDEEGGGGGVGAVAALAKELQRKEAAWEEERSAWEEERSAWAEERSEWAAREEQLMARAAEAEKQLRLELGVAQKPRCASPTGADTLVMCSTLITANMTSLLRVPCWSPMVPLLRVSLLTHGPPVSGIVAQGPRRAHVRGARTHGGGCRGGGGRGARGAELGRQAARRQARLLPRAVQAPRPAGEAPGACWLQAVFSQPERQHRGGGWCSDARSALVSTSRLSVFFKTSLRESYRYAAALQNPTSTPDSRPAGFPFAAGEASRRETRSAQNPRCLLLEIAARAWDHGPSTFGRRRAAHHTPATLQSSLRMHATRA